MALWLTTPVTQQPSLTLKDWSVIELPDGERHFVGYCVENCEGRVSSPIKSVDPHTLRGSTSTGRVYQLRGEPGHHSDAQYVLSNWLAMYKLCTWTDLSDALWLVHLTVTTVADVDDLRPEIPAALASTLGVPADDETVDNEK